MSEYIKASNTSEFSDGSKKKVVLNGQEILLVKAGGQYYASSNKCPHLGGDLSAGKLEGTVITCPRHGSQFDLKNGEVLRWTGFNGAAKTLISLVKPARPVKTYNTRIENGGIFIEI